MLDEKDNKKEVKKKANPIFEVLIWIQPIFYYVAMRILSGIHNNLKVLKTYDSADNFKDEISHNTMLVSILIIYVLSVVLQFINVKYGGKMYKVDKIYRVVNWILHIVMISLLCWIMLFELGPSGGMEAGMFMIAFVPFLWLPLGVYFVIEAVVILLIVKMQTKANKIEEK